MLYNLATLRSELANMLKTRAIANDRRDRWLNLAQEDVAIAMDPDHLIVYHEFTSVTDQREYMIPFEFNKILSLVDTTQDLELLPVTENQLEEVDPDRSDGGTSYWFSVQGLSWVSAQPTSASVITVVSSDTGDTSQKVRVNGLDANGTEITELIDLNGTTSAPGSKSFTEIRQIVKDGTTTGDITATSNGGAVTNVIIPSYRLARQYQPIHLFPIPSGTSTTYRVRGVRRPKEMVNTEDFPDFPEAYHELVLIGAEIRGHFDRFRPTLARTVKKERWEPKIKELKGQMGNKRTKSSVVIRGGIPIFLGGRLPSEFLNSKW